MAAREASIRITMKANGFLAGLRDLRKNTEKAGDRMGTSIRTGLSKGAQEGVKNAKKALKDLGDGIKSTTKNAASFGGALGGAALIGNAMQLQGLYAQVANEMERATGKAYSVAEAQTVIVNAAEKTKRTHEELGEAMRAMLDRGADPGFAIASMESVGNVMNATGQDAERIGRLMAGLSIKYGLNAQQGAAMLDEILITASKGKIQLEEYMEDFNEFGSLAHHAGLQGEDGLRMMLNLIQKVGPQVNGTTSEISAGLDIVLERMRDVGIVERLFKEAGKEKMFNRDQFAALDNAKDQMNYLMQAGPEMMKVLAGEFPGREEKAVFEAMFGPYFAEMEKGIGEGLKESEAHQNGMDAIRKHQMEMTKPLAEQGQVAEQSARAQRTGAAKMRDALNKLSEAMTKPEMLSAIDSLAESLPPLASTVAKALEFVAKNPMLSAGMFAGAKVGLAFGQGMLVKAGTTIGTAAATSIRTKAAASGAWGTAGKALGVAAAAIVAYEIGKAAIDEMYDERGKELGGAVVSEAQAFATAGGSDLNKKQAELQAIQGQIRNMREKQGSFGGQVSDAANQTFGALAGTFGLTDGYTDTRADSIAKLEAAERQLQTSIEKQTKTSTGAASATNQTTAAMREATVAAREMGKAMKEATGTGGPKKPGHTGPGYAQ